MSQSHIHETVTAPVAIVDMNHQLRDDIRRLFVVADERSVFDYLRSHRRVPSLLIESVPHLRRLFGDAALSLRATSDEDGWDMLYATVRWAGEPEDALRALDRFDDEWWLAHSYPAGKSLTFTYDLV